MHSQNVKTTVRSICCLGLPSSHRAFNVVCLRRWSAGKPACAVLLARLQDRGVLRLEDRVAAHVPEFAARGKGDVRLFFRGKSSSVVSVNPRYG